MASFKRNLVSRPLLVPALILVGALAGCNLLPVSQGTLHAADVTKSPVDEQSQLMYELLIAELAGRRGYVDIATEGYVEAAMRTQDPRVAERATKLSVWGRRWQEAERMGLRWVSLDPQNSEARQLLAQVHMRQGKAQAAADQLAELVADNEAERAQSMQEIYQFLVHEPNRAIAVETMTELRNRYSDDSYASLVLGQLALDSRDYEAALAAADKSLELDTNNNSALLLRAQVLASTGKHELSFSELREALAKTPENIDLRLGLAQLLVGAGRYDDAATELEISYEIGSDNPAAVLSMGLMAVEARRNAAAQKYLSRLLEMNEYENEAHFYLARIADSQQQHAQAIEHYEQVTTGDNHLDAQIRAAEIHALIGDLELGRERLARLAAGNDSPQLQQRLVRAEGRMLLDSGQAQKAVSVLTDGLKSFPDNAELLYSRALAAERSGDPVMFEGDLRTLIKIDPENAHAMNALGYHFAEENTRLDEAEELLVKANSLLPDDPAILDSLGWLRFRQGAYPQSIELLKRAYSLLKDTEIAAHLGEVMWVTGDEKSATELWSRALAERPGDPKLKSVMDRFSQ